MPDQKVAIPDEWVDAGCEAAFVPPISADRRADMRAALEAVLPKVRERLLSDEALEADAGGRWFGISEPALKQSRLGLSAALDAVFPQDESGADPGIEVGGTTHDQKGR